MIKIIVKDRFYIPAHAVKATALKEHCELKYNDKSQCRPSCKLAKFADRSCSTCPTSDNHIRMWERIEARSGNEYIAIPNGDSTLLDKIVSKKYTLVDKRNKAPFQHDLEWTGKLRRGELNSRGEKNPNQKQMLSAWRKHVKTGETGGLIVSPARSGKCVSKGTMIRTDKGYQLIEDLFENVERDQVGVFGNISVPHGVEQIRGLHQRLADTVICFTLANGIKLSVTPEHPLVLVREKTEKQYWVKAENIKRNDYLVIHGTQDPTTEQNKGLTEDEAALLAHIFVCCDLPLLQKEGTVTFLLDEDYPEWENLNNLFDRVLGYIPKNKVQFDIRTSNLKNYQTRLLASNDAAWKIFIRNLFECNLIKTPSILLPTIIARALHFHLITHGVEATLINSNTVVIHKRNELHLFLTDKINHDLKVRVSKIQIIEQKQIVYDLMILPDHAFITDGITSHNTVIGVASIMSMKQRAFITASQRRFLLQFAKTFGKLTNVKDFYERGRYPVVFVDPKKWPEAARYGIKIVTKWDKTIEKADVILATYQQFISEKGKQRLKRYISRKVGMVVGDEIHLAAAPCFSRVVNRSNVRYRLGLTATTIRKDCVSPQTLVQTKFCKKQICEIKEGDEVMSYSFSERKMEFKKVVEIHHRKNSPMFKILTEAGELTVTPDHEFWVEAKNAFVKAKDLTTNDILFSGP